MLFLLVPLVCAGLWRFRGPSGRAVQLVTNAGSVAALPSFAKVRRRARWLGSVQTMLLAELMVVLVVLAARPQRELAQVDTTHSHDIVMCLDASLSMREYLPDALNAMSDIEKANPSDRYAIVIFQDEPYVALPLTGDVAAIQLKTQQLAAQYANTTNSADLSLDGAEG